MLLLKGNAWNVDGAPMGSATWVGPEPNPGEGLNPAAGAGCEVHPCADLFALLAVCRGLGAWVGGWGF